MKEHPNLSILKTFIELFTHDVSLNYRCCIFMHYLASFIFMMPLVLNFIMRKMQLLIP